MDCRELVLALRALGLTQSEIGERAGGLTQGAISHIETGRRKNVLATTQKSLERLYSEEIQRRRGEVVAA